MIGDGSNIAKQGSTTLLKKNAQSEITASGLHHRLLRSMVLVWSSCFTQHILIWFIWRFPKSWGYSTTIIQVPMVLGTPHEKWPAPQILSAYQQRQQELTNHVGSRSSRPVTGDSPNYPWPMRTPWPYRVHWHLGFVVLGVHRRTLAHGFAGGCHRSVSRSQVWIRKKRCWVNQLFLWPFSIAHMYSWLVVDLPLWNILINGKDYPRYYGQ